MIYNSWPLGYVVNPNVAKRGLASELAGVGQPYNWVFVYGDVACGAIMLAVVGWILWQCRQINLSWKTWLSLISMTVFCLSAAAAALLQVRCVAALGVCPSLTNNPVTLLHTITSLLAGFGLLGAVLGVWLEMPRNRILAGQFIVYLIAGAVALLSLFVPGPDVIIQNVFITVCSLYIAAYPWSLSLIQRS